MQALVRLRRDRSCKRGDSDGRTRFESRQIAAAARGTGAAPTAMLILLLALFIGSLSGVGHAYWEGPSPFAPPEGAESIYTTQPPNIFYHNMGLLQIMVTNVGVIGTNGWVSTYGAGWRGGEYLFAAALWIGAIASDNLSYVSTGAYENEMLPSLDPLDTIYQSFEGITGGDRAGFSSSGGDDDQDGRRDEDFHNGRDDDGDGRIDEDYAAISQQMFSCEYWDYEPRTTEIYAQHRPLHIRVRQRSFAWSTEGANEFVGFEYDIINEGFETLRDIYIGYFVDSDAGLKSAPDYYTDDGGELRTVDTTYIDPSITFRCTEEDGTQRDCAEQELHIDIAYMHDTPGSASGGNAADDMGAGADGYFGGMFLGHTTDPLGERAPRQVSIHSCRFFSGSGTYPDGDPRNDYERYDLLSSGQLPRRPTGQPADYRYCFSGGPFAELLPGESLQLQVAFVIGNGWSGLLDNALMAQRVYNGQWRDTDNNVDTGCDGRETCLHIEPGGERVMWYDPCDSLSPGVLVANTNCSDSDFWVDDDCNCCTPQEVSSGCDGRETLIHWVGTVAPPPPPVNTEDPRLHAQVVGDRRIRLEWNNASEMVADPISGEIRFCGYRIWRVEGWDRPIGSTGPAPEDWELVADLSVENERVQPKGSQLALPDYTNPFAEVTDTIPAPDRPGEVLYEYEIGRYAFEDTLGLKNGMLYFYDVTAYACWEEPQPDGSTEYVELSSKPTAREAEGVRPEWAAVTDGSWRARVMAVPNPWRGRADWDLTPSDADPTGTHIDFALLPDQPCDLRIYTVAGDLVQTLSHDGRGGGGTVRWNMISRNGQDITSGVYLYAVTCGDETTVKRFTVIR